MARDVELIHTEYNDPKWNMPYTPAIKVHSGTLVFLSGVTAAPVYHSNSPECDSIVYGARSGPQR